MNRIVDVNLSNFTDLAYYHNVTGPFCDPVWDGIMCWDATKENTVSKQRCPEYINGLSKNGMRQSMFICVLEILACA